MPQVNRNPHFQRIAIDCELKISEAVRIFLIPDLWGANYVGIYNGKIGFFKSMDCCKPIHICRRGKRRKIRRRFYRIEKGKLALSFPEYLFGQKRFKRGHHYGSPVFYEVIEKMNFAYELVSIPLFNNKRNKESGKIKQVG